MPSFIGVFVCVRNSLIFVITILLDCNSKHCLETTLKKFSGKYVTLLQDAMRGSMVERYQA